jgi:hypothetical protein
MTEQLTCKVQSEQIIIESLSLIKDASDIEGKAEGDCEGRLDLLNADLVIICGPWC